MPIISPIKTIVQGAATGEILSSTEPLSFWGGVCQKTGEVTDTQHPLHGENIKDRILVLPSTSGSPNGSLVILELLINSAAPAGLVFLNEEEIVTTGVIIAQTLLGRSIPVFRVNESQFNNITHHTHLATAARGLVADVAPFPPSDAVPPNRSDPDTQTQNGNNVRLSYRDRGILNGDYSIAAAHAMNILIQYARLRGMRELVSTYRTHIDSCIYTGPASLLLARTLLDQGADFAVSTTLSSTFDEQRCLRELGVDTNVALEADGLVDVYVAMGGRASKDFRGTSQFGGPGGVVYRNSFDRGRTQRYPALIDICIALTGRRPVAEVVETAGPNPSLCIDVRIESVIELTNALYPLLGYAIGKVAADQIPLITGLETTTPTTTDLQAFSAAFATTSSAPQFYLAGHSDNAAQSSPADLRRVRLGADKLVSALDEFTTATDATVGLVSLGNPNFTAKEFRRFSQICAGRHKADSVEMIITTSPRAYAEASASRTLQAVEAFGAKVYTDPCWSMRAESAIDPAAGNIMTNCAKYALCAPGMARRGVHYGSLRHCINAAETGRVASGLRERLLGLQCEQ
ncbi:uncharacterized protein DSM5745_07877 [Aspergillus mulundensis]|uniref:Aconitase X catalytic domain-containing protein n=1 Tax=Aspergillus mulundensis TaxID=1810919 RepID=A0A3D8RF81_9EURO|nr:hypothetical protein DSM5745_07877 [Aspergillus mulundensis]RDW72705.1 hypothetical protein DSM5745_07877 [Aspergillus mulundensis]